MTGWSQEAHSKIREGAMAGLNPIPPSPATAQAFDGQIHSVCTEHGARQNKLLAALPEDDFERLQPDLEPFPMPLDWAVHAAGGREEYLYFLTSGIVSRFYVTQSGATAEFAVTGNEGVVGVASFLGGISTPSQAVVLTAGHSYRLPAVRLKDEFTHDGPLPRLLLRYTQALIAQIGLTSACKRHHALEQRLSRWILCCLDRLPTDELAITQGLIAAMLGVRREAVTKSAGSLQKAGLLHFCRGRMVVLDRPGLEAHACECYTVLKREYFRLLAEYRKLEAASGRRRVIIRRSSTATCASRDSRFEGVLQS
jgi:CRP-like cAMP-binding protein